MKKILTLLLAAGAFLSVQAQSKEEARRVILGGGNGNGSGTGNRDVILGGGDDRNYPNDQRNYPSGDRQNQIDQINREYDNKIQSIRNNQYLTYEEKQRAIRQLEKDRQKRLKEAGKSYRKDDRYDDDRDDRDDRYERDRKGDNGKHKGWYKKDKNKNWKKGKS